MRQPRPQKTESQHLDAEEALRLRRSLEAHIEDHPARIRRSAIVHSALQRGITVMLLAAFPSLTLLYVAGNALPTHGWLYSVKRGAEEVAVYLQPNSAGRISYRTEQIRRRVTEVAQLTRDGAAGSDEVRRLERDLVAHIAQVEVDLQNPDANEEAVDAAKTQLAAKTKVLTALATDSEASEETKVALERIVAATTMVSEAAATTETTASTTPENQDAWDTRKLDEAGKLLASVRVDVKRYLADAAETETAEVIDPLTQDLQAIVGGLEKRLVSLKRLEHLADRDRDALRGLLVDLEAFSELFDADPLVARRFTIETNPSDQTASSTPAAADGEPAPQTVQD